MVVLKKLYRSTRDKKLFGLCGGVAELINVDATLLRILLIVAAIFTSGFVIPVYIIAGFVVPKEPPLYNNFGPGPGYGDNYGNGNFGKEFGNNNSFGNSQGFGTQQGGPYKNPPQGQWSNPGPSAPNQQASSQFDNMMDDLEKKALRKEIEELRTKLTKLENEKGEF